MHFMLAKHSMEVLCMWESILVDISLAIGEAIFSSFLNNQECSKLQKELSKLCNKEFRKFAGSTLDTDEFYYFIKSERFILILRNFYFTISDGKSRSEYLNHIFSITEKACPKSDFIEIRDFIKKIDTFFSLKLHKIINNNKELTALLAVLTISNRNLIQRISESEDNLIK